MLNQDQIRAQQAAVQTSLFTATIGSTQRYSGFQSSVISRKPTQMSMRVTPPVMMSSAKYVSCTLPSGRQQPSMAMNDSHPLRHPAPIVAVPKSSWISAPTPIASQRMSMTKQPYMSLAGNNKGNKIPGTNQMGQNSINFSAAVPPSSGPVSSLQGPANIARGRTVMNAAALPMDGEGYDGMKDMQDLKQKTLSVLQDKLGEMKQNLETEAEQEFTVENVMESRSLDLGSFTENRPASVSVVEGKWDEKKQPPNNLYKPKDPYSAKVVFNTTLTGPDAGEVCHMVFDHDAKLPYAEGQSIGVVAKGLDAKGKPHKLRLYSIASSAPGDYGDAKTVSLCVKRLIYDDEDGKEVKGVCSNYLCDLKAGDEVDITGPVGKALLLPDDPKATVIMLATGTGVAPFRSFLWRYFMEKHPDFEFGGNAWLFLGVPTTSALLYDDEFKKMKEMGGDKFKYDYAISREATDANGDKMYIQNKMKEYGQELWDLMQKENTYVYMCGLKGMETGIKEALGGFAEANGVEWADFVKTMKKEGRYHVEVY